MNTIYLEQGDALRVRLADAEGEFEVHYNTDEHPGTFLIKEVTGLPGNVIGEGKAVLYQEDFLHTSDDSDAAILLNTEIFPPEGRPVM